MAGADHTVRRREGARGLHDREELAYVAGPAVREDEPPRLGSEGRVAEGLREQGLEVARALAEGPKDDLVARDPVVEVAPELTAVHQRREVPVRGRDDAQVHAPHRGLPEPPDLPLLQDPEELPLQRRGEVPDLVEEERAARGFLDEAAPVAVRARERAPRVPEELRFRERRRKRREVHGDEGSAAPRQTVRLARDDLLSRSALAAHEERETRRGDPGDLVEDGPAGRVLRDDRGAPARRLWSSRGAGRPVIEYGREPRFGTREPRSGGRTPPESRQRRARGSSKLLGEPPRPLEEPAHDRARLAPGRAALELCKSALGQRLAGGQRGLRSEERALTRRKVRRAPRVA